MKKLLIVAFIIMLCSCSMPKTTIVTSELPEGYSKGYFITGNYNHISSEALKEYITNFSTDTDDIIMIDNYSYLILRK